MIPINIDIYPYMKGDKFERTNVNLEDIIYRRVMKMKEIFGYEACLR